MPHFCLLFGTSPGFLQPDWVLFPGSGCGCFCIQSGGSAVPFRSGWRCSHLWYCFGGGFSGGWASFIITSVPGSSGRQSCAEGSSRSGGRHRRSSGCGTPHASRKRPGDRTPSPVCSSCWREASSRSTSESSEEVRVESPPPTAGRSLTGGTPQCVPARFCG